MKYKFLLILFFICGFTQAEIPIVKWAKSFGGTIGDFVVSSDVDTVGNLFVTGYFDSPTLKLGTQTLVHSNTNGSQMFIAKFNPEGVVLWAKQADQNDAVVPMCIKVDRTGDIIACGQFTGKSVSFGSKTLSINSPGIWGQFFMIKYDTYGNIIWLKGCDPTDSNNRMTGVAVDDIGNIYATGLFFGPEFKTGIGTLTATANTGNLFLIKYDGSGNALWAKVIKGQINNYGRCITVDKKGSVFIGGSFEGYSAQVESVTLSNSSPGYQDIFLAKYNTNGQFLWVKNTGSQYYDQIHAMTTDKSGNVYIGGYFDAGSITFDTFTLNSPQSFGSSFLVKLNSEGKAIWAKNTVIPSYTYSYNAHDALESITVDQDYNVYVTGSFDSYSLLLDTFLIKNKYNLMNNVYFAKYNSKGNALWAKGIGKNNYDDGISVAADQKGSVYLSGNFASDTISIDTIMLTNNHSPTSHNCDFFVSKMFFGWKNMVVDVPFCDENTPITIATPSNYKYYTWINQNDKVVGNSQTLIVTNPVDSAVYRCKFLDAQDSAYLYTFTLIKSIVNIDFSSSLSDCATNTVQFTNQSTTNRGSLTYRWDFGDGATSTEMSPLHKYNTLGIHLVSLSATTSPTTCTNSISKTIIYYPKPTIKIEGDSTLCHGVPVTLKAQGADSYKWSTGSTSVSISVGTTQKVWLVGYSASGCVSDTAYLKVTDRTPIVTITGNTTYCPGLSSTLKVHGASSYKWSTGSTSDSIKVSSPGSVWVVGYSSTCVSDTVRYSISEEPDFNVSLEGNLYICSGESATLTALGADSYKWSTGEATNPITIHKAGSYSVTGINKRGCEREMSFNVTEEKLLALDITVSSTTIDSRHNKLTCKTTSTAGIEYSWNMGDGSTEHGSETEHTYNIPNSVNTYTIILTATNTWGCSNSLSKAIDVILFIPNVFSPNGDGVNDVFMPEVNLEIQDRNGILLFKGTNGWDGNYHLKKMPDDTYYYVVTYKDKNGQTQMQKGYVVLKR